MKLTIGKNEIFTFLFFTLFLDAYSFIELGNRDITPIYIGFFLLICMSFIHSEDIIKGIRRNPYALLMFFYMLINYLIKGNGGISSLLIGMFCWLIYIVSYRKSTDIAFNRTVRFFRIGMNVMAIYGIYQVIAYKLNLPFADPWLEGMMVTGYNWGNFIDIAGMSIRRANAVFREPSYFSQFLALNILIYFSNILSNTLNDKSRINTIKWIACNGIALVLTFSGTGILMLVMSAVLLLLMNRKQDTIRFLKKYFFLIIIIIISCILLLAVPNHLMAYLVSRTSEFNATNAQSISGYIRMVLPYQASLEILSSKSLFWGCGIGNASEYIMNEMDSISFLMTSEISRALVAAIQPIVPRTIAEEGLIGGTILLLFFIKMWKQNSNKCNIYKALLIGTYIMSFMHGTWSSEVYWLLLSFLNIRLNEEG